MSAQHTPGPWASDGLEVWGTHAMRINLTSGGTPRIAVCDAHTDAEREFPAEANARLIAAAPELLEVLKTIVRAADGRTIPGNLILDENSPLMEAARDAITKVLGSQS